MTVDEAIKLLIDAGFKDGWVLYGTQLVNWEHEQEPPAPFIRPQPNDN